MKNKTKLNLKRALLFFIPLCLIAGMFAVPAFAEFPTFTNPDSNGIIWASYRDYIEPLTLSVITYDYRGTPIITDEEIADGYTMLTCSASEMADAYISQINDAGVLHTLFNYDNMYWRSYMRITYLDGSQEVYPLMVDDDEGDDETAKLYISNGASVVADNVRITLPVYTDDSDVLLSSLSTVDFFFSSYPPLVSETVASVKAFWQNLDYTVYYVQSTTPDDGGAGDTSGIFAVWTQITDWIINGLKSATNAFYYNGQLTLLGYLCIIPLALGVALLLISIIQKFLRLRG